MKLSTLAFAPLLLACFPSQDQEESNADSPAQENSRSFSIVQEDAYRDHLELKGGADHIVINSAGHLWLGTNQGQLLRSTDRSSSWDVIPCPGRAPGEFGLGGDKLEHVGFFDSTRAIVAGYIGENQDAIFRTGDGGETWSIVDLPVDLWVYDCQTSSEGTGWLVGSTGDILFTRDHGETWERTNTPYDGVTRSQSVHFVSEKEGIVGANHNRIHYTSDGGVGWRRITTPADEYATEEEKNKSGGSVLSEDENGKLVFVEAPPGPDSAVEEICLLGSRIVALQEGKVYWRSLVGEESWTLLSVEDDPVALFELHPQGLIPAYSRRRSTTSVSGSSVVTKGPAAEGALSVHSAPLPPGRVAWLSGGLSG